jgi:deoxyribodipyrimidine photolyase-related protein
MSQELLSVWILGDQLMNPHPAITAAEEVVGRENVRVVLVESDGRVARLPYQRKKLVLLFSAMRHYADELRDAGYTVDYEIADSFSNGLRGHLARHGSARLMTMQSSEYRMRRAQEGKLTDLLGVPVDVLDNSQFLIAQHNPYPDPDPEKNVVMEYFYRDMRRHFDVLMTPAGEPEGGAWNFDKQNRKPLPKKFAGAPPVPTFAPDEITQDVMQRVARIDEAVGTVDGFDLAVTRAQAEAALDDFIRHRLADFGPYEDAMSADHAILFHSVLSPYVNIGLLDPMDMVRRAEAAYRAGDAPINSVEGFVRQVLGWREYIYWQYWQLMPGLWKANGWEARRPMPRMFWDGDTDMACIRHVARRVIDTGYSHHIERLMVVCNFCLLAGIDPAAVAEWFLAFYIDAYEWVVLPNVIGMGLNADGGRTATKPYIASANYINKMGDYCKGCRFNPKQRTGEDACPFNSLYWNFLIEHEELLRASPRMGPNVLSLRHLDEAERDKVQADAAAFLEGLAAYV